MVSSLFWNLDGASHVHRESTSLRVACLGNRSYGWPWQILGWAMNGYAEIEKKRGLLSMQQLFEAFAFVPGWQNTLYCCILKEVLVQASREEEKCQS